MVTHVDGLIAFEPVTEWLIHVYLLHARPIGVGGRRYDLLAAREHRAHHAAPGELDGVLVPTYALLIFLPAIAGVLFALSLPLHLLVGGGGIGWWLSGVLAGYAILQLVFHVPLVSFLCWLFAATIPP